MKNRMDIVFNMNFWKKKNTHTHIYKKEKKRANGTPKKVQLTWLHTDKRSCLGQENTQARPEEEEKTQRASLQVVFILYSELSSGLKNM